MINAGTAALGTLFYTLVIFTVGIVVGANTVKDPLPAEAIQPVEWVVLMHEADRAKAALDSVEVWISELQGVWAIASTSEDAQ